MVGVSGAHQLRPITLLSCDYKLLTKVMVRRLINVLPTVLTTSQLCSVKGRSIYNGITAILSVMEAKKRQKRPGFLLNLDFFHAYDWVCMPYADRVLGFGDIFRGWVRTLHSGAAAVFLLDKLSRQVAITFSIRQGDPLAMLIYIIHLEPFLWTLHRALQGLDVAGIVELALAFETTSKFSGMTTRTSPWWTASAASLSGCLGPSLTETESQPSLALAPGRDGRTGRCHGSTPRQP